tara:strand:- start:711 stop:1199 length:489 start_codon:yes stop_codon:yes gene_type:complete
MNIKKIQKPFQSTYVTKLKGLIKTELGTVYLTTDSKKHLNEYNALIHESDLEDKREQDRRCDNMKTDIAEIVCAILKEKQWGIFFKNEPMQSLPVQDNTAMFKVNEVREDELVQAIVQAVEERVNEWQNHQKNQGQTEEQSSSGTSSISTDTEMKSEDYQDL